MQLNTGVFEAELPLSEAPVLGDWTITAELNDEVNPVQYTLNLELFIRQIENVILYRLKAK